jgi:benzylsuccinate CoA-transferase BbsF subunit
MFCGRLFADLGAEVVKVEFPGGDTARSLAPLLPGEGDEPISAVWVSYMLGKRLVEAAPGGQTLASLLAGADVVLHGYAESEARALGIPDDEPGGAVVVAITPFGYRGPLSGWQGSDLVHIAMGGYLHMTGAPAGRPIRPSAPVQSYLHAGNHAFIAALVALRRKRETGAGAFIDQAIRDTGSWMLTHTYQHWDMQRVNLRRLGQNRDMGSRKRLKSVYRCADGFAVWMFATGHLGARPTSAFVAWMDREGMAPAWLTAIDWTTTDLLMSEPDLVERLEAAFAAFLATKRGEELLDFAIEHGLMMAPVSDIPGVATGPQLEARESWRVVDQPGLGRIRIPGPPVRIDRVTWESSGPAPLEASPPPDWAPRPAANSKPPNALPLLELRILDLGSTLAAPTVGRHMSDLGADVIKIETHTHPDTLRVGTPYANESTSLDRSGYFGAYNAGKRSFALNLQTPEGKDVLRRLVERSDVLLENYAPGVMTRLGLPPEVLLGWNPRLVVARHSLQGQTGPRSRHRGYGQIASALTGWYELTGDEGGEPLGPYSAYTDFLSWPFLFAAVLLALDERDRGGAGVVIDHAQIESSLHFLAPLLLDYEVTGRVATRRGNHDGDCAPSNSYPGREPDSWLAITVTGDAEFRALVSVLGEPGLAGDPRFATTEARRENEDELDALLDTLTQRFDTHDLAYRLQEAGIAAGPVARASDLFADPQYDYRKLFRRLDHAELGDHAVITHSFRISGAECGPRRAAPLLGEHTFEIATELLGMDSEEIAALVERGVLH